MTEQTDEATVKEIAEQIASARRGEREERLFTQEKQRSGKDYVEILMGLEEFLDYTRNLPSKLVVDVGAGTTQGVSDLSKSDLGYGLEFKATVLTYDPKINKYLGREKTITTSAERLRGIKDNSVGGILCLNSILFSADPETVVKSLDRVLVPGGVVKSTFLREGYNGILLALMGAQKAGPFIEAFEALGYDVASKENKSKLVNVLLAKKPGGSEDVSAKDLIGEDLESVEEQMKKL